MILPKSQGPSCGLPTPEQLWPSSVHSIERSDPKALTGLALHLLKVRISDFWSLSRCLLLPFHSVTTRKGHSSSESCEAKKCLGKRNPQTGNYGYFLLFPHLTGWQVDVRKWPSICESQLKAQNSLTHWLLELNLTVYIVSIKDLCKNPPFPCSLSSGLRNTTKC